tara:strand:- start:1391 stop:1891 length:501 start_codon:yes stop_codon:yes gene_type:complete
MKKNIDFTRDKTLGEKGESLIMLYLLCNGYRDIKQTEGYFKEYDIYGTSPKTSTQVFFEVKTDEYCKESFDSGNMAIEIECKKKPSGISCTEADVFVYYYYHLSINNLWMIKVDELKSLIKKEYADGKIKTIYGGDNNQSKMILLKRNKYKEHFFVDTITKHKINE